MLRFRWITFDRFKVVNLSRFYRVNFIRPYWVNFTVFSTKEVYQAMSEEERLAQPIFGALKPIESQQRQMEVTQTTNAAEAVEDPDDLPF